jgi:hypothetical protein
MSLPTDSRWITGNSFLTFYGGAADDSMRTSSFWASEPGVRNKKRRHSLDHRRERKQYWELSTKVAQPSGRRALPASPSKADRLCGCGILVRSNHGHFCSGSVRVKPLPPSRWPNPHDFRARRIGRLDVLWKESGRFLELGANPNRLRFYVLTLFFEWLLFVLVVSGVRHSGAPVRIVLGDQRHSVRQVLRDIGIAAAFWIVSAGILFVRGLAPARCRPGS